MTGTVAEWERWTGAGPVHEVGGVAAVGPDLRDLRLGEAQAPDTHMRVTNINESNPLVVFLKPCAPSPRPPATGAEKRAIPVPVV